MQPFASAADVKASEIAALLQRWTEAAARMAAGQTAAPLGNDLSVPAADSGEALGLAPARLTLTFGFGATLFVKDGRDRFGLAARRPDALVDLPLFNGDQLAEGRTGGDLSVQACADDPQVAFHAARQLARLTSGTALVRWAQTGYMTRPGNGDTPRNLMGFKDGTSNPSITDPRAMTKFVWVGDEGPVWMRGGSYVVARRIRIALEHWDRMKVAFQEQTFGPHKYSGAPHGGKGEFDPVDPRTGFIKIFSNMSKFDMLNQFVAHTGGGLFACPGGIAKDEFRQRLFDQTSCSGRLAQSATSASNRPPAFKYSTKNAK